MDKLESYIPERLLTHKAKIRRMIALEEKEAKQELMQAATMERREKNRTIEDDTMDLIVNADQHSSSQTSASY